MTRIASDMKSRGRTSCSFIIFCYTHSAKCGMNLQKSELEERVQEKAADKEAWGLVFSMLFPDSTLLM